MSDVAHGLKKLVGYFVTGLVALLFFGITGWLLLIYFGYSFLQGTTANNNYNIQTSQQNTEYSQSEVGKLPPEQVTTPIKQGE